MVLPALDAAKGNGVESHGSRAVVNMDDDMDCARENAVRRTDPLVEGNLSSSLVTLRALGLSAAETVHEEVGSAYRSHSHHGEGTWHDLL
jgi:hypothetical protein